MGDFAIGFRAMNALSAEAKACYHAIVWAKHIGWDQVSILTDCLQLVQNLGSDDNMEHTIATLILDIKSYARSFNSCKIFKVDRSVVCNAHNVARGIIN